MGVVSAGCYKWGDEGEALWLIFECAAATIAIDFVVIVALENFVLWVFPVGVVGRATHCE